MSQRVLYIYRTYFTDPQGALQEAIRQICGSTSKTDAANTIFTLSPTRYPKNQSYPEASVPRYRSWAAPASCDLGDPRAFLGFNRLARDSDLLHYFFPWRYADILLALTPSDPPKVMTYISDIVRQRLLGRVYRPLMEKTLRQMRTIVANAPSYVDSSPIFSRPDIRRKVEGIPLGIDEASYPQTMDKTILERIGLITKRPCVASR